jgi:hypothetical protein
MPATPVLSKLRQEDKDLEASVNYIVKPCLKKKKKKIILILTVEMTHFESIGSVFLS